MDQRDQPRRDLGDQRLDLVLGPVLDVVDPVADPVRGVAEDVGRGAPAGARCIAGCRPRARGAIGRVDDARDGQRRRRRIGLPGAGRGLGGAWPRVHRAHLADPRLHRAGLVLGGIRRRRQLDASVRRLGQPALIVLHHVGQLVQQQPIAGLAARRELAAREVDVRADRDRAGACGLRGLRRGTVGVDPDVREAVSEQRLHARAQLDRQRRAARRRQPRQLVLGALRGRGVAQRHRAAGRAVGPAPSARRPHLRRTAGRGIHGGDHVRIDRPAPCHAQELDHRATEPVIRHRGLGAERAHAVAQRIDRMQRDDRAIVQRHRDRIGEPGVAAPQRLGQLAGALQPHRLADLRRAAGADQPVRRADGIVGRAPRWRPRSQVHLAPAQRGVQRRHGTAQRPDLILHRPLQRGHRARDVTGSRQLAPRAACSIRSIGARALDSLGDCAVLCHQPRCVPRPAPAPQLGRHQRVSSRGRQPQLRRPAREPVVAGLDPHPRRAADVGAQPTSAHRDARRELVEAPPGQLGVASPRGIGRVRAHPVPDRQRQLARQAMAGALDDRIEASTLALALDLGWVHPPRHRAPACVTANRPSRPSTASTVSPHMRDTPVYSEQGIQIPWRNHHCAVM